MRGMVVKVQDPGVSRIWSWLFSLGTQGQWWLTHVVGQRLKLWWRLAGKNMTSGPDMSHLATYWLYGRGQVNYFEIYCLVLGRWG